MFVQPRHLAALDLYLAARTDAELRAILAPIAALLLQKSPALTPNKYRSTLAHMNPPVIAALAAKSCCGTVKSKSELIATPNAPSGRMPNST